MTLSLVGPGAAGVAAVGAAPMAAAPTTLADVAPACGTVPLDVELIIDHSGSMTSNSNNGHTREYWAQQAAFTLIDRLQANGGVGTGAASSTTGTRHRVGVTQFSGTTASVVSALASRDAAGTKALITSLGSGNTPFKLGMSTGAGDLTGHMRTTDFGLAVQHIVIFLSDGRPNPDGGSSTQRPTASEILAFQNQADQVFSIAVGSGGSGSNQVDLALMQSLAKPNDASHSRNIVDLSGLPAFFDTIFSTIACTGSPTITKTVTDGASFPGGQFDFSVACGTANLITASIALGAGATTGSTTVSGIVDGAFCTVSEKSTLPDAGASWTWGVPVYTGNPASIVAGGLRRSVSPTRGPSSCPCAVACQERHPGHVLGGRRRHQLQLPRQEHRQRDPPAR